MNRSIRPPGGPLATHLVVGSGGPFGRMIGGKLLQAGLEVWGIDLRPAAGNGPWHRWIEGSIADTTEEILRAVRGADYIWLCVSERQILDSLSMLAAETKATGCITDIASVKNRIAEAVKRLDKCPGYLSIHPMFGPVDDIVGLNVITVRLRENSATKALEETLESWDVDLCYLTADEHDLLSAYVQVLPHAMLLAFGDTLARCGKDISTLRNAGTPIHKLMMILLSRIITNTSTAYWSIQAHNPHASRVRREALCALRDVDRLSQKEQEADFDRLLNRISEFLLPDLPDLRTQSCDLLDLVCRIASKEFRRRAPEAGPLTVMPCDRLHDDRAG